MSLAINYPSYFPCPNWQYSHQLLAYQERVEFSSGWTRQRRQWPEAGITFQLAFDCNAKSFYALSRWFWSNGFEWFRIRLDDYDNDGIGDYQEVRLISDLAFNYRTWDDIGVTVQAELKPEPQANTKPPIPVPPSPGPGPIPPTIPWEPPTGYDCGAYYTYLTTLPEGCYVWEPTSPRYPGTGDYFALLDNEIIPPSGVSGSADPAVYLKNSNGGQNKGIYLRDPESLNGGAIDVCPGIVTAEHNAASNGMTTLQLPDSQASTYFGAEVSGGVTFDTNDISTLDGYVREWRVEWPYSNTSGGCSVRVLFKIQSPSGPPYGGDAQVDVQFVFGGNENNGTQFEFLNVYRYRTRSVQTAEPPLMFGFSASCGEDGTISASCGMCGANQPQVMPEGLMAAQTFTPTAAGTTVTLNPSGIAIPNNGQYGNFQDIWLRDSATEDWDALSVQFNRNINTG